MVLSRAVRFRSYGLQKGEYMNEKETMGKNSLWDLEYISYSPNMGGSVIYKHDVVFKRPITVKELYEKVLEVCPNKGENGHIFYKKEDHKKEDLASFGFIEEYNKLNRELYDKLKDCEIKSCTCCQEWCSFDYFIEV